MTSWQTLRRQIALSGQVTAVADNAPVANAQVQITTAPTAFMNKVRAHAKQHGAAWEKMAERVDRTSTAVDGFYYFLDLPDGEYTVTAHLPEPIPTYDFGRSAGQVSRDEQGTIQQAQVDVQLEAYSGQAEPPAFTPTDIADCQLWLQAEALVLPDGEPVTRWPDSSDQATAVTQANSDDAPLLGSTLFNGRAALEFDGESNYLTLDLANTGTDHTFFAVYDQTPTLGSSNYLFEAQTGRLTLDCAHASDPHNLRWQDSSWRVIAPAISGKQLITWLFSDTTGEIWRNSALLDSATYTPKPIGGTVTLGANYQGRSSHFKGNVAEFLYYGRALSLDERQAVEEYLNGRYAIFQ